MQQPRDVPGDLPEYCFPAGRGLCCPDDPLDLVLHLFPAHAAADDRAPPSSLAALGIGGAGAGAEPPRREQPLAESAFGGGGGWWDSWGLSSCSVLEGLRAGLDDEIDVDMFFADDGRGDGGEATTNEGNLELETKPKPPAPAHLTAAAGGPVHVHTPGSLGSAVPNDDASPWPAPMPAGGALQAFDACHAFDAAVFNSASPSPAATAAAPMPAGVPLPPPVFVADYGTTPLLAAALMPPAAAALAPIMPPQAAPMPLPAGGGLPPVVVANNGTPSLLAALMPPPALEPMPAGGGLPPVVVVTNNSTTPPLPVLMPTAAALAPMPMAPAAGLHACGALSGGIVSNAAPAPPPLLAPIMPSSPLMVPTRALHRNATLAGVYSSSRNSAPPSASPPSGSGRSTSSSSTRTSEPEFLQQHQVRVVPTKQRSPPSLNRRKRPWQLDFPLHALPPPAALAPPPPAGADDDEKNRYAMVPFALAPPPGNTGGAGGDIAGVSGGGGGRVRRRRAAPRQRNRQAQAQRVCTHCDSAETPQWRAGPDGPGTLCNACGIRHAFGRLVPEYRPSTAPSFRSGQHSNRHRKVMKIREEKGEEKPPPSSERRLPMEEDGADEKDDDGSWVSVRTYQHAAGL